MVANTINLLTLLIQYESLHKLEIILIHKHLSVLNNKKN